MSRFLIIAAVGAPQSLLTDGSTTLVIHVVKDLVALGHYCYVVFPEGCDIPSLPQVEHALFLTSDFPVSVLDAQSWCVDQPYLFKLFSIAMGKYMVDAVMVLHGAQVLPVMQTIGYMGKHAKPPVFVVEQGTNWITTAPGYRIGATDEQWHVQGVSYAHLIVVSEFDRQNWEAKARAFDLSPKRLDLLLSRMRVASAPTNLKSLQSIAQTAGPRYETPTCLWAARTNRAKNPELVVAVFDEVFKQGHPIQVKYLTQTSEMKASNVATKFGMFDERQYIQVKYGATPEDFYQQASKSHVYVCWSHSESYNVSVVEASLLGCVFLCRDNPALRALYPFGLGGEKYWLQSKDDAVAKVTWVLANYEQAYAEQQQFRDEVIKQQSSNRIADVLERETNQFYSSNLSEDGAYEFTVLQGVGRVMAEVVAGMPDEFTLHDVLISMQSVCNNFNLNNAIRYAFRKVPPNWCIHQLMKRDCQVQDLCDNRNPRYRKIHEAA